VNEIQPYEQLIAAKLDQLPVPDMSDSIWASIDKELDAPASPFNGKLWSGLAGLVAVVALLWWYFSHKVPAPVQRPKALPEQHAPMPVVPQPTRDSARLDKPVKKKDLPVSPAATKKDPAAYHPAPADSVHADSAVKQILPPIKIDSGTSQKNKPALPDFDLYETRPAPPPNNKKHKGVKGITEDDYKISAGKDSTRKKN
jgi:hypothetical protein